MLAGFPAVVDSNVTQSLPVVYFVREEPSAVGRLARLRTCLQRHRLLFLWYATAHPATPGDAGRALTTKLRRAKVDATASCPTGTHDANALFDIEQSIESWHGRAVALLGSGRGTQYSNGWDKAYPYWTIPNSCQQHLHASYQNVTRCVGRALVEPLPAWMTSSMAEGVAACRTLALVPSPPRRRSEGEPTDEPVTWDNFPAVAWDYPVRLANKIRWLMDLEPLDVPSTTNEAPDVYHSPDFRNVRWYGKRFTFTKTQAKCIAILWKAWDTGFTVHRDEIMQAVDSVAVDFHVSHIFRDRHGNYNRAWKDMIQPEGSGKFRLHPPNPRHTEK